MKPKIIPPSDVANEIADALKRLAADCELRGNAEQRKQAAETRMADMLRMFTPHESLFLIRLIVEPRVRCAKCKVGRSLRDSSGAYCEDCAVKMRRAAEAGAA